MDSAGKKKILVLVEGEKTDVALMKMLFGIYAELDAKYEIVPYRTNIYALYQEFFNGDAEPDSLDLLQVLKAKERDPVRKLIFSDKYTDILLSFDLDPQDHLHTPEKIRQLQDYFNESSDMGKLYINYPMIEAFYHMEKIPDPNYLSRTVPMDELIGGTYKQRVNRESRGHDYRKFITSRGECNAVILQNIGKALHILGDDSELTPSWVDVKPGLLLEKQLACLQNGFLYVLCTSAMFIYDYNSALLFSQQCFEKE